MSSGAPPSPSESTAAFRTLPKTGAKNRRAEQSESERFQRPQSTKDSGAHQSFERCLPLNTDLCQHAKSSQDKREEVDAHIRSSALLQHVQAGLKQRLVRCPLHILEFSCAPTSHKVVTWGWYRNPTQDDDVGAPLMKRCYSSSSLFRSKASKSHIFRAARLESQLRAALSTNKYSLTMKKKKKNNRACK